MLKNHWSGLTPCSRAFGCPDHLSSPPYPWNCFPLGLEGEVSMWDWPQVSTDSPRHAWTVSPGLFLQVPPGTVSSELTYVWRPWALEWGGFLFPTASLGCTCVACNNDGCFLPPGQVANMALAMSPALWGFIVIWPPTQSFLEQQCAWGDGIIQKLSCSTYYLISLMKPGLRSRGVNERLSLGSPLVGNRVRTSICIFRLSSPWTQGWAVSLYFICVCSRP